MYARTNSVTLTARQASFAFSGTAARSTEPEVFTFEQVPAHATAVRSYVPVRPKKRCTRVLYPAKVRMHLPPPERSQAKRWLAVLCLVVLWQIYTEDGAEAQPSNAETQIGDYKGFPFQSAEEEARQLAALSAGSELPSAPPSSCGEHCASGEQNFPDTARSEPRQDADGGRSFEQSASNSYVVALLVYHRLGSDK